MFRFQRLRFDHLKTLFIPRSETEWETTLFTATSIDYNRLQECRGLAREYPLVQKIVETNPDMNITARILPFIWNIGVTTGQGKECHKKSEWKVVEFFKYIVGEAVDVCSIHTRSVHFHIKMLFASHSLECFMNATELMEKPEFFKSRLLDDTKQLLLIGISTMEASRNQPWEGADPIAVWPWILQPSFVDAYINLLFALWYLCVSVQKMNEDRFDIATAVGHKVVDLLHKSDTSGISDTIERTRKDMLQWAETFLVDLSLFSLFFQGRKGEIVISDDVVLCGTKAISCCMRMLEIAVKKGTDEYIQNDVKMSIYHMFSSANLSSFLRVTDEEFQEVVQALKRSSQHVGAKSISSMNINEIIRKNIFSDHIPSYEFITRGLELSKTKRKKLTAKQ